MADANQIVLKGKGRLEEAVANAAISPGDLVEVMSTDKLRVHSTEGGYAERAFAVEDALQGRAIETDYAAADIVTYKLMEPGSEVQAWLKAGENVVIGDELISSGAGSLIKNGSEASGVTVKQIVAEAREAIDLSASGAVDTRINIRVH